MNIAVVMLAPGRTGFYDDLSGIHLTLTKREAGVSKGVNTAGLVQAVQAGKIITVSGSLVPETLLHKEAKMAIPTYYRLLKKRQQKALKTQIVKQVEISEPVQEIEETIEEVKIEVPVEIEMVVETTVEDEVIEEIKEEVVVEEIKEETPAPKKRTRKKKETAKKED